MSCTTWGAWTRPVTRVVVVVIDVVVDVDVVVIVDHHCQVGGRACGFLSKMRQSY